MTYIKTDFSLDDNVEIDEWGYITLRSGKVATIHLGKTVGNKPSLILMPYDDERGTLTEHTIAEFTCDHINPDFCS